MQPKDFDPNAPLLDDQGLEYENLADLLRQEPVDCPRNDVIRIVKDHPSVTNGHWSWKEAVHFQYLYTTRYGAFATPESIPQGIERFAPAGAGSSEGDGPAGAGKAPADPVHPAP